MSLRPGSLWATTGLLLLAATASGIAAAPIDPGLYLDTEAGPVRLSELGPGPYIVAPIFASCRTVCMTEARSLAAAWGASGPPDSPATVLLVSFDPEDEASDLAHFREMFDLPAAWHLARLEREEGLRFFEYLGFRWRTVSERRFDHAGKVFVLNPSLEVTATLGPDQLTAKRLSAEVRAASDGASIVRRLGTHWIGFFGVGSVLLLLLSLVAWERTRTRVVA